MSPNIAVQRCWRTAAVAREWAGAGCGRGRPHAVPTIGYRSGGLTDGSSTGSPAFLVDDSHEAIERLAELLADDVLREELGRAQARIAGVLVAAERADAMLWVP